MSPQPKQTAPDTTDETQPVTLAKGQHNPFLAGIIEEGKTTNEAIAGWYKQRDALRQQARMAVQTGFASKEQAGEVAKLYPFPNRKKKDQDGTETANGSDK